MPNYSRSFLAVLALFLGSYVPRQATAQVAIGPKHLEAFRTVIAPLVRAKCLSCHGPDRARGGLDLSHFRGWTVGGDQGPAIVPGKSAESLLLKMVRGPRPRMPRQQDPLTEKEVAALARWIDAGAPWPKDLTLAPAKKAVADSTWWSLQPLRRPAVPPVKDGSWSDQPLDRFILASLESKGMKPSPEADRATYLRRVTFDLTGLPPTPEDIDAFLKDDSPEAYEKLVDRLLASPRYAERWGRHWLDIIRYADTHGFDKDKRRLFAYLLRDWIIRAFHQDMPYRRFLLYQLAGDILFPDDPEGVVAAGFIAAGPWDFVGHVELREGTVEKEKTRTLDRDEMVSSTFLAFNSLTVGCARCHDHKFDPISQKDYYRLQAVFAGVERGDRPVVSRDQQQWRRELDRLAAELSKERELLLEEYRREPATKARLAEIARLEKEVRRAETSFSTPSASPTNGWHSGIEKKQDVVKWVQIDLGESRAIDAVRLLPARPTDFPDSPGFGFPHRFQVALADDAAFEKSIVLLDRSARDFPNPGVGAVTIPAGGKKGRYVRVTAQRLWKRTNDYVFALAEMQVFRGGRNLALGKPVSSLDSIEAGRWSRRHLVNGCDSRKRLPQMPEKEWAQQVENETKLQEARRQLNAGVPAELRRRLNALESKVQELEREKGNLQSQAKAYTILPRPPRPIHVLHRGDVQRKGDQVQPAGLSLLPNLDKHFAAWQPPAKETPKEEGARRAALARWLADDANPLTWRSIVNRVWQYHFGQGLVDTPNDFGRQGNRPTHPELLDWLASEFREHDSFKHLHRMIVLSRTYRQASAHVPEFARIDAGNRYLWRMNRRRLEAEAIRDGVLAVSGKLDLKMFGPGFDLFRFKDDHSPVYDHLDLKRINAPDTWRRSVYRFVVRSVPNPFLECLDCADPNVSVPVRNDTVTALQALALLNNPFMVEQAEFFARRLEKEAPTLPERIDRAVVLALGRRPAAEERAALVAHGERHGLANVCRLLFNLNEFVFVD